MKKLILAMVVLMVLIACSTGPKLRDVSELFPPRNVRVYAGRDGYKVLWEPSIDESRPSFAGYNLYFGVSRLVSIQVRHLPPPLVFDKSAHEYFLSELDPSKTYFLHLRSRDAKGDLSLPSLPEIEIAATSTF